MSLASAAAFTLNAAPSCVMKGMAAMAAALAAAPVLGLELVLRPLLALLLPAEAAENEGRVSLEIEATVCGLIDLILYSL